MKRENPQIPLYGRCLPDKARKGLKRVLICPLNWGLGHATRDIPVIYDLLAHHYAVMIAADGDAFALLKKEFPELPFIRFPSFAISYTKGKSLVWKMMCSIPEILRGIFDEHKKLSEIIHKERIDIVISDNRFGLWNSSVVSIFITHQLMIKMPKGLRWFEPILHGINRWFIKKYDECWIPDNAGSNNFSGDLSHKYSLPAHARFIGILSRFRNFEPPEIDVKRYSLVFVLSGPEPQRTILERLCISFAQKMQHKSLIIRGKPDSKEKPPTKISCVDFVNHLPDEMLGSYLQKAQIIICRSGYSTIMDLAALNQTAILIPTPGQTEQEYLAEYHRQKKRFYCLSQKTFASFCSKNKNLLSLLYG